MSGLFGNCGGGNNFGCNSGCNPGCDNDRRGGGFKMFGCEIDCCTLILILLLLTNCCNCDIDWCTIIVIFLLFSCCGFNGFGGKHGC